MKIKEIEYGELRTDNYNNYKLSIRVELEEGEDFDTVMENLKNRVAEEISKAIADDRIGNRVKNRIKYIEEKIREIDRMLAVITQSTEYMGLRQIESAIENINMYKRNIEKAVRELKEYLNQ